MRLSILDPIRVVYQGNAREVVLPGADGELSVLDFHQPFLYSLRSGYIKITQQTWQRKNANIALPKQTNIVIKKGMARMERNELVILVELETAKKA